MSLLAEKSREQIKALRAKAEQYSRPNTPSGYDQFWEDDELVELYLEPGRIENFRSVAVRCPNDAGSCIDLGCGVGTMLAMLADRPGAIDRPLFGVDYSAGAVRQSQQRVPLGRFSVGDVYRTGFVDEMFSLALSIQTMEHLQYPSIAAREMWRILQPGGVAVITIPNGEMDTWDGHVNFWSPESFVEMFGQAPSVVEYLNRRRNLLFEFRKPL